MVVSFAEKNLLGKARSRPDLVKQVIEKARREGFLSTLEAAFNRLDQPMSLGYSSCGRIIELGDGVQGLQPGMRVACAGGGYAVHAEYAVVPKNLLVPLPDHITDEQAAFTTLGAIALHGFRLAQVQIGARVAVIGLGLLGLLAGAIARAAGCQVLGIDLDPGRVSLGEKMGLHQNVLRPEAESAALSFSRGLGLDAVLICADTTNNDPVQLAGNIARDRARVIAVGAVGQNLPRKVYYEKELTFLNSRSYGPGRYDPAYEEGGQDYPPGYVRWTEGRNLEAVVNLLSSGALVVNPLISHRFPIERAPDAYELILGKSEEPFLGVLLTYPQDSTLEEDNPQPVKADNRPSWETPDAGEISSVDEVRLGMVGAGNFATAVMLPAIRNLSGVRLVSISSASGASAAFAASKFGFSRTADSFESQLADHEINTVAILTRHHLHTPQILQALAARKHVFCEKPLAIHPEELDAIEEFFASTPNHPHLTVGFNRRFAPLVRQLGQFFAARNEPLVMVYRINAGALPLTHWLHDPATGGGRILGEACHFIDLLSYLAGAPPRQVQAWGLADNGRYREDNVTLNFRFPDGSLGSVAYLANGDRAFGKERLEVFCAGQVAVLDDFHSLETVSHGKRRLVRSRLSQDKGFRGIWEAFVNTLTKGEAPPIPYEHLFGVTRATFAAVNALRSDQVQEIPKTSAR